jgi:hypothetical protein
MIKKFQHDISPPRGAAPTQPPNLKFCTYKLDHDVITCAKFHLYICRRFCAMASQKSRFPIYWLNGS